jgi:hypothetical protein
MSLEELKMRDEIRRQAIKETLSSEAVKGLEVALRRVDDWFEGMKKDQHEKLVEGQTFESACENWKDLKQDSLDMEPIKDALQAFQKLREENQ